MWLVETIFLDSSQLLPVKAIFPSTGSYFLANPSFRLVETCFLFEGKSVFKDEPYSCCGNLFFNMPHPASANGFSAQWKKYFFGQSYIAASRNHYWN